jgi:hypothetical protein
VLTQRFHVRAPFLVVAVAEALVGQPVERVVNDVLELVRQGITPPAVNVILIDEDSPVTEGVS